MTSEVVISHRSKNRVGNYLVQKIARTVQVTADKAKLRVRKLDGHKRPLIGPDVEFFLESKTTSNLLYENFIGNSEQSEFFSTTIQFDY